MKNFTILLLLITSSAVKADEIYTSKWKFPALSEQRHTQLRGSDKKESPFDPMVKRFINKLNAQDGKPLYKQPPSVGRKVLEDLTYTERMLPADIESYTLKTGPLGQVKFSIIRPEGNREQLPVIIYMHGGGWVFGELDTHDRLVREIANGTKAAVVFVHYTRAPEGQFPLAHEQGYTVAEYIAKHGNKFNLDTKRMAIAGDSVGGLMATAITMMAKKRGGPHFLFQALMYPVTNANFETKSYRKFAKGYYLDRDAMKWFWDNYVPDKEMRKNPIASPLLASLEELKGLPPALVIVDENDVLRDEGEAYAHKLMQAGVPTVGDRYLGLIHDFAILNDITKAPGVRAAIAQVNCLLRRALAKK